MRLPATNVGISGKSLLDIFLRIDRAIPVQNNFWIPVLIVYMGVFSNRNICFNFDGRLKTFYK